MSEVEALTRKREYPLRLAVPPQGAYCTHDRMRLVSCGSSICGKRPCRVECPCGVSWMFEDEFR